MSKRTSLLLYLLFTGLLFPAISFAQSVGGQVLSQVDQSPVPGVTIAVKGTRLGTATDISGKFSIRAKEGDILVISGVGITRQEMPVGTSGFLTISVVPGSRSLSEVVVTATGIKKESKRLAYAIQTVDASTLTQAREADPINSLKGQAAGLEININSEIGHPADVIMRGENAPNDRPLFVVDGVPISSDTYNVNADDIESFTVLKGPNAAALYGFQGKNGAIIINTKKGTKDKRGIVVNLNSSTQVNQGFIALPKYQDLYGPGDNGKYAFGGGGSSPASYFGNGAVGVGINDYDYDVWGPQFRGQLLPQFDGTYDPTKQYTTTFADGSTYKGNVVPTPFTARGKDNLKKFLQVGALSTNSISIASSTEKTDFRMSLGNTYQQGIVPNTKLNNANFTESLIHRFNDHFSITSYFNYSRQSSPNVPDVQYGPNSIIYNIIIWGGADWSVNQPNIKNYWQPGHVGVQQNYEEYYRYNNPWFMSYQWLRSHYQNNEYGYVSLNYKVNQNLDFQLRPSVSAYDMFNSEKMPYSAGVYGRPLRQGDYREDRRSQFESITDLQARYHRNELFGFLDLAAIGGGTVRNLSFNSNFESTNYLNVPGIYAFTNSLNPVQGTGFNSSMLVLSAYYSVDLGYKSFITANITGRVDKSSALPSNSDAYFYPSFNLATVVSDYANLPKAISFLKFKASYAESKDGGTQPLFSTNLGNVPAANGYGYVWNSAYGGPIPSYQFSPTYTLAPTYSSQSSAQYTDQLINPNIQTQDRKALEFGADIRFLNNRIGLDLTRYHYRNTGIVSKTTTDASGYSSELTNGNVYTNDGWEAVVTGRPFVNPKGFSWNVTANFFTYIRKWAGISNPNNYEFNGKRTDLVYGDGFVRAPDGKLVIDPVSGLNEDYNNFVGSPALKVYGHADPNWQWGLINTLSYKTFSLRFQFDGLVGGVVEDYVRVKTLQGGRHIEAASGAIGAARPSDEANIPAYVGEGVNLVGAPIALDPISGKITNMKQLSEVPNTTKTLVQPYVYNQASIPDLNMINKTYVKLRELALSYNFPLHTTGNSVIQKASVSLVGRNLLYFFPNRYKDLDVDQYTQDAGSGLQTPTTRSYGLNFNLTF